MSAFVRPEAEKVAGDVAADAFVAAMAAVCSAVPNEPGPKRAFQLTSLAVQALQMAVLRDCPEQMDDVVQAIGAAVAVSYGMSGDPSQVMIANSLLAQGFAYGARQAESFLTPATDVRQ